MATYELLYIIPPKVKEPDQTRASILTLLKEGGVDVWMEKDFGRRRTSYAVDHTRNVQYVGIEFEAERGKMEAIKKTLNVADGIARFHIAKIDKLSDKNNPRIDMLRAEAIPSAEPMKPRETIPYEAPRKEAMPPKEVADPSVLPEKIVLTKTIDPAVPAKAKAAEEQIPDEIVKAKKEPKVSLEDLDKKLDEILDQNLK